MARFDYRKAEPEAPPPKDWNGRLRLYLRDRPQIPYILPFFIFVLVMLPGQFRHFAGLDWETLWKDGLPLLYPAKTLLAALLLWLFWPWYTRIVWRQLPLGVLAGLLGTVLWIASELLCQRLHLAAIPSPADYYNPDLMLPIPWQKSLFLCLRVAGPSLVVPIMEELFFRDFLLRTFIAGSRFDEIPVATFSWTSLLAMCALFGINHGPSYFFPGFLYGLLMALLLYRTKSLCACIVAHGTTNLTLYLFVIYKGHDWWQFM